MQKINKIKIFIFACFFISITICENKNPYSETVNELIVRKKLSSKIPDVFNNKKFYEISSKLDNIAQVNPKSHADRLIVKSPEYHWCYAQTYFLAGNSTQSLEHYKQYKIQSISKSIDNNPILKKSITELEIALENQQSQLAKELYTIIENIKNINYEPETNQVIYLQKKLNQYNEFNRAPKSNGYFAINQPITEDGVIGPETKSAIYDFEQNNPYIIETGEIERTQNIEKTISLLPSSITPVSTINNIENISEDSKSADLKFPSHSSSHIALSKTTIIDQEKINSMPGNSTAEILEHILGINIIRSGVSDVLSGISINGGTGEHVLILIDGLKISNQQTLYHDLDLPINIDDIKQIEIIKNASAKKYGTGAVSGVINIVTKKGNEKTTSLKTEMGDYSLLNSSLSINVPIGKSFHNLSYSDIYSSGYLLNTDYLKRTLYYKYSIQDGNSSTDFSFGYLSRGNGIINSLSNNYESQYESNETKFFNSKILWEFNHIKIESNMHWLDRQTDFAQNRNKNGWINSKNSEIGINFSTIINWKHGTTQPSFSYIKTINSNSNISEEIRDNFSLSIQHNLNLNKFVLNLGLSTNYYNDFGLFSSPGYQIIYNINNNANLFHQYDHGFRLPSFYELNADNYLYDGNRSLDYESTNSFEHGIQLYGSAMKLTLSQFYKNSKNVIDWYSNSSTWKSTNIDNVLTSGYNIYFEFYPEIIKILSFINRFEFGYSFIDIEHNGVFSNYKDLSNYLKHQMTYGLKYKLPLGLSNSWHIRYEQPNLFDNRTIVDTQIHHRIWRIESSLNISNLFDTKYSDVENIILPGRWIKFSLKLNL